MSVTATVTVDAAEFPLGQALAAGARTRVRLERVVPVGQTSIPYVWATNDAIADVERTLRAEAEVDPFEVVDTASGEALVRLE